MSYHVQLQAVLAQLEICREGKQLRALLPDAVSDPDLWQAVLEEAVRFAEGVLAPVNAVADRHGCVLEEGRVRLHPDQVSAWAAFGANGWMSLTVPERHGGQGLPMLLLAAVHEFFERACVAFCMIPGGTRAASRLIEAYAGEAIQAEWMPRLATGEWTATICISEADAGSDVGRARTRADPDPDGTWRITGEKMWISFGDHDGAKRIGHMVLARSEADTPGVKGLSLFLVPTTVEQAGETVRNGVITRRVEEKIGLHGSPTCALGFENARGELIGERGKGLRHLFRMITAMRLSVGVQGIGVGTGAAATARAYAAERRQGGPAGAPAVSLDRHADVRLALLEMNALVETQRGLTYAASALADLADLHPDPDGAKRASLLLQWLLPLVKTGGGETAFDVSGAAVQVLGGAGITKEWPVEQALRDARALTIYEGTSGIQAIDLLRRRLLSSDPHFEIFEQTVRAEIAESGWAEAVHLSRSLDSLMSVAVWMRSDERTEADRDCGATALLRLALLIARGWIALRLLASTREESAAAGRYWLALLEPRAAQQAAFATVGQSVLAA